MVTAPVMLAETPILRYNPDLGKYYVKFRPETIEKMMRKYFKENKIHKVNTNHDSKQKRDGIYMMESYIVGERNSSKIFPDLPERVLGCKHSMLKTMRFGIRLKRGI